MSSAMRRREFLELTLGGAAVYLAGARRAWGDQASGAGPVVAASPGPAKVARIFLVGSNGLWPTPALDMAAEKKKYDDAFARLAPELAGVTFTTDAVVSTVDQIKALAPRIAEADGVLLIHLSMGVAGLMQEVLAAGKPTMFYAAPYSGHEWAGLGAIRKTPAGAKLGCILTSDFDQLATAVRPLRAIGHLRNAKIVDVTTRKRNAYVEEVKSAFGTEIETIGLEPVLAAYNAVPEDAARAEADAWTKGALEVREPSAEEVVKSCRLALAFEALLAEHGATAMTVDCYGSMYEPLCKAHAFPCIGFTRLNDRGLAGICESDLECAMTYLLFQGLTGRPSFISDPTMDESSNSIILAHCLGTRKMDGPDGPVSPYRLRTIMERQEGCVPQVFMPVGRRVTQARFLGTTKLPYFTGEVIDAPDEEKGCRTKITVKLDGPATKLWENYAPGLHRLTCYGDVTKEMAHFARFNGIAMIDETA
jgi:hypothetical protein